MTDYHFLDALRLARHRPGSLLGVDVLTSPHIETPKYLCLPAHPIICWLSQFLACFGCQLDPWVHVPLPPERRRPLVFEYEGRLIMHPSTYRGIIMSDIVS